MVTQGGRAYPMENRMGVGIQDQLTLSGTMQPMGIPTSGIEDDALFESSQAPKVNYLWYILGVVILLAGLKYASEHEKSGMEPRIVGVGVYNWIVVGVLAMLFMLVGKTILNKYPVKGLTDLFNAA